MNAIIIAAGLGKRISNDVKNIPKSMVKVNGRPIIEYQLSVLNKAGINEIYVITGPNSEKFNIKNVKYVKDEQYQNHDILGSLMEAKEFFKKDTLIVSPVVSDIEEFANISFSTLTNLDSKSNKDPDGSYRIRLSYTPSFRPNFS